MPIQDDADLRAVAREDDEGLFGRNIDGQLVRVDTPTESDYTKQVALQIDGHNVTVPMAEPLKDAQGNIVLDLQGRTTPRYTTIYDAATKAYDEYHRAKAAPGPGDNPHDPQWREFPIPVLCHQPHMKPVAVCRMCVVQVYGQYGGKRAPERRLLPACQFLVKQNMEVFTMYAPGADGDKVRKNVGMLTELLTADHLKLAVAPAPAKELEPHNELKQLANRFGQAGSRFAIDVMTIPAKPHAKVDSSSPVFIVDKSACILCDRCVRACDDVKQNHIIGRSGKGQTARIGFDLDLPMGESNCVQCGECMVSCPTSAITFKPVARVKPKAEEHDVEMISANELIRDPLLAGVPPKFLLWQEGLVVRKKLNAGEPLCLQGDPGNTAFFIRSGQVEMRAWDAKQLGSGGGGLLSMFMGKPKAGVRTGEPTRKATLGPQNIIVGEMSCLSGTPRTADLIATAPTEVWEVRRNVLDRIMRSPTQRARFEVIYRENALDAALRTSELFQGLDAVEYDRCVEFLRKKLNFVRVSPGQVIFQQGDQADCMYLVRLGHVRVGVSQLGREVSVYYAGPGSVIGEIGLLAMQPGDGARGLEEVDRALSTALERASQGDLMSALPTGRRSARCTALDHLEMARIGRKDFLEMIRDFSSVRQRLLKLSLGRMRDEPMSAGDATVSQARSDYVKQGLYQGQSLLAIDLVNCTRCDQCTQACSDQHGNESHGAPFSRLMREGLRFGNYLVTTSCRSCKDAYCMIGCPVDSIHRGKHGQIVIEDHCIGCGLCANNCPYGNIFMLPNQHAPVADGPGGGKAAAKLKAAACDLCDAEGIEDKPKPRCVYSCPHDAAIRLPGEQLLQLVTGGSAAKIKG